MGDSVTRRSLLLSMAAALDPWPISWIALDLATGAQSGMWSKAENPIGMGSLLKPFVALGYYLTHTAYPVLRCAGARSGCWYAAGHGEQHFVEALANSCNTYFLALSSAVDRSALETVCLKYGLQTPRVSTDARSLIGLAEGWPQSPVEVARAFRRLALNRSEADVQGVLAGMARCAACGTARAVGFSCYAKTGTAACSHTPSGSGDGFAVAIYPQDQPRRVLLVEHHNVPGAVAARDVRPLLAATI